MGDKTALKEFTGVSFGGYSSQKNAVSLRVSIPIAAVYAELSRKADAIFAFFGGSRLQIELQTVEGGDSPDTPGQQRMEEMVVGRELNTVADVASCRCNNKWLSFTLSCVGEELEFGELEHFKFQAGVMFAKRIGDKPKQSKKDDRQAEQEDPNQGTIPFPERKAKTKASKKAKAVPPSELPEEDDQSKTEKAKRRFSGRRHRRLGS
jgi:hypothetical protein